MTNITRTYINALLADSTYALEKDGLEGLTGESLTDMLKSCQGSRDFIFRRCWFISYSGATVVPWCFLYFYDNKKHSRPHIHAEFGEYEATIAIDDGAENKWDGANKILCLVSLAIACHAQVKYSNTYNKPGGKHDGCDQLFRLSQQFGQNPGQSK
jgi:hypothetical protein